MIWSGTTVMGGHAEAVVVATGMKSYVGGIADMLTGDADSKTPLQKRLAKTGTGLGNAALVTCLVIFAVSLIKGFPPAEMFLTSVSSRRCRHSGGTAGDSNYHAVARGHENGKKAGYRAPFAGGGNAGVYDGHMLGQNGHTDAGQNRRLRI